MNGSRALHYPTDFFWGLATTVGVATVGAFLYGGGAWALGALVGGTAVAADFAFLAAFSVTWLEAGKRGSRYLVLRGILALVAKVLIPPAAVLAVLWSGAVEVYAVAFSALAVAAAAPILIGIHFLRRTSSRRPVP